MLKNIISLFLLVSVALSSSFAAKKGAIVPREKKHAAIENAAAAKMVAQTGLRKSSPNQGSPMDITWTLMDSMANVYGTSSPAINPLVYDPWSNSLAMIHRGHAGYSSSSGTMWYGYSLDEAATWSRSSQLNADIPTFGRYPSSTFSNPTHSTNAGDMIYEYSYPQLNPSAFGYLAFGLDPFMAGTPFSTEWAGQNNYSSQTWIAPSDDGQTNLYFFAELGTDSIAFWRTVDQGGTWTEHHIFSTETGLTAIYDERIRCVGNTIHVELLCQHTNTGGDAGPIVSALTKSTDNGETWSDIEVVDWRTIPALSVYDDWGTKDGRVSHDFIVDANHHEHMFYSLQDTAGTAWDIVEVYRTATGWDASIIAPRTGSFKPGFAALTQSDNEIGVAIDKDGGFIALKWIDAPVEGDSVDTDIFMRCKRLSDNTWTPIMNVTQTQNPDGREMSTHIAPYLKKDGENLTAYLAKSEQLAAVVDDSLNDTQPCAIWAGKFTWMHIVGVVERESGLPRQHALYTNYPNPFNPATKISFDIATPSNVSLKVYDITGQEVATLLSGYQQAGKFEVAFNASGLSSGVYFYTLQAGEFSATQKMLLSK